MIGGLSKAEKIAILLAVSSAFLFPDVKALTYLGRIIVVLVWVFKIIYKRFCQNAFYFLWCLSLTAILILNLFVSVNFSNTLSFVLATVTGIWASFVIMDMIDCEESFYFLANCIIICGVLFCVRILANINFATWGNRKVGTMLGINVNSIGIRCVFVIIICLYCIYKNKNNKKMQCLCLIALCMLMAIVFITGSRRALLLACISIAFFMIRNADNPLKALKTSVILGIGLVLVIYAINTIPELYAIIGERMQNFFSALMAGESSAFDDGRDLMAKRAIELFWEKPLWGWGIGTFPIISGFNVAYSHNNYAELLYTTGLLGFLGFYSFLLKGFTKVKVLINYSQECTLFMCIILVLLISDLVAVNFTTFFTQIFIGIILTLPRWNVFEKGGVR